MTLEEFAGKILASLTSGEYWSYMDVLTACDGNESFADQLWELLYNTARVETYFDGYTTRLYLEV